MREKKDFNLFGAIRNFRYDFRTSVICETRFQYQYPVISKPPQCEFSENFIGFLQSCGVPSTSMLRETRNQQCQLLCELRNIRKELLLAQNETSSQLKVLKATMTSQNQNMCIWEDELGNVCGVPCRQKYCEDCRKRKNLERKRQARKREALLATFAKQ